MRPGRRVPRVTLVRCGLRLPGPFLWFDSDDTSGGGVWPQDPVRDQSIYRGNLLRERNCSEWDGEHARQFHRDFVW